MDALSRLSPLLFRDLLTGVTLLSNDDEGLETSVCDENAESLLCLLGGVGVLKPDNENYN